MESEEEKRTKKERRACSEKNTALEGAKKRKAVR